MRLIQKVVFCAAHRLMETDTVCKYVHGHNYEVWFTVSGPNKNGMVIDFFDLEELCKAAVSAWDHGIMLRNDDPLVNIMTGVDQKVYVFDKNPTCETMVEELPKLLKLPKDVVLKSIRLKEMDQYEVEKSFV